MSTKAAEFLKIVNTQEELAASIANMWDKFNFQRQGKIEEWKELRNYIFATDTTKTSNSTLPWKNKTTLPKLCQIRDNLHSNYLSALFPNDSWLKWEPYTREDATRDKVRAIEAYMSNKTREGHFRKEMSKLLYDYIDYGNAFATSTFEARFKETADGPIPSFIGPKAVRISPLDIIFNPLVDFADSFKIIRSVKNISELKIMSLDEPDNIYLQEALARRDEISKNMRTFRWEDTHKDEGYSIDGFGNLSEYYMSGSVEILEFWGDWHDESGGLRQNRVITIIDRASVIRDTEIPSWLGTAPIYHVGWRTRPDNAWAMGPLDNLVGMQYRIDHLENLKADALDLAVLPPLVIAGEVEEFQYGPGAEIHIDEGGSVTELGKGNQWVIGAENQIQVLESRMEQYAGAPSEAMGIRTPGEKTAFEVQQLQNAGGRIFQEKITTFEQELLEPELNAMLESARRNLVISDVIRVMDDDLGVQEFLDITKEDITASGKIRPIGARHFAAEAQLLQNLNGVFGSPIGQLIAPHTSSKQLSKLVEDAIGIGRYDLFKPNVAVQEQAETQRLAAQTQEDLAMESQQAPLE